MHSVDLGRKQELLASFFNQNRDIIKWDAVPETVKNATLAAEDVRFYQHGPIDPSGIARALVSNLMHKDIQGASTISQQYVKNVCVQQAEALTDKKKSTAAYDACTDKSYNRKIREMRLAIGLEKKYDKDQILLGYLNIAGFGGRTYGIEAAAQYYYDRSAKDLDIGQAATLISIVNNPEEFRLDVKANLAGAEGRRNYVLGVERSHGMITAATWHLRRACWSPVAQGCRCRRPEERARSCVWVAMDSSVPRRHATRRAARASSATTSSRRSVTARSSARPRPSASPT